MDVKSSNYEVFILALSLLSLVNIVLIFLPLQDDATAVIYGVDTVLVLIFMGDFLSRLFSTSSKRDYFIKRGGWLDLIGSLPFPLLRLARIFRVTRSFRRLAYIGPHKVWQGLLADRAETALYTVIF